MGLRKSNMAIDQNNRIEEEGTGSTAMTALNSNRQGWKVLRLVISAFNCPMTGFTSENQLNAENSLTIFENQTCDFMKWTNVHLQEDHL